MGPRALLAAGLENQVKQLGWKVETQIVDELVSLSQDKSVVNNCRNPQAVGALQ